MALSAQIPVEHSLSLEQGEPKTESGFTHFCVCVSQTSGGAQLVTEHAAVFDELVRHERIYQKRDEG